MREPWRGERAEGPAAVIYSWASGRALSGTSGRSAPGLPTVSEVLPGCCQDEGPATERSPPPAYSTMTILSKNRHSDLRFTQQPLEGWLAQGSPPRLGQNSEPWHPEKWSQSCQPQLSVRESCHGLAAWFESLRLTAKPQFPHL